MYRKGSPGLSILLYFVYTVTAYIEYQWPSDDCFKSSQDGSSTFCCDGNCIDNTFIGTPGQCQYWVDFCHEVGGDCGSNAVLASSGFDWVSSDDDCYIPSLHVCQWTHFSWTWRCCPCPDGFTAVYSGCATENVHGPWNQCVRCTGSSETLTLNPVSNTQICTGPDWDKRMCDLLNDLNDALGALGAASNLAAGLCPFGLHGAENFLSNLATGLSFAQQAANWIGGYGSYYGINGNAVALATSVAGLTSSLLVGAAGVELGEALAAACLANTALGGVLGMLGNFGNHNCPSGPSKRDDTTAFSDAPTSTDDMSDTSSAVTTDPATSAGSESGANNPCQSLLGYFDGMDFTTIDTVSGACDKLWSYSDEDTMDQDVADGLETLRQTCMQFYLGGDITTFSRFAQVMSIFQKLVPYCDEDSDGFAAFSSATEKKGPRATTNTDLSDLYCFAPSTTTECYWELESIVPDFAGPPDDCIYEDSPNETEPIILERRLLRPRDDITTTEADFAGQSEPSITPAPAAGATDPAAETDYPDSTYMVTYSTDSGPIATYSAADLGSDGEDPNTQPDSPPIDSDSSCTPVWYDFEWISTCGPALTTDCFWRWNQYASCEYVWDFGLYCFDDVKTYSVPVFGGTDDDVTTTMDFVPSDTFTTSTVSDSELSDGSTSTPDDFPSSTDPGDMSQTSASDDSGTITAFATSTPDLSSSNASSTVSLTLTDPAADANASSYTLNSTSESLEATTSTAPTEIVSDLSSGTLEPPTVSVTGSDDSSDMAATPTERSVSLDNAASDVTSAGNTTLAVTESSGDGQSSSSSTSSSSSSSPDLASALPSTTASGELSSPADFTSAISTMSFTANSTLNTTSTSSSTAAQDTLA